MLGDGRIGGRRDPERLAGGAGGIHQYLAFHNRLYCAGLAGRGAGGVTSPLTLQTIRAIVEGDSGVDALTLASDMGGRTEDNLDLLEALLFGLRLSAPSA